MCLTYFYPQSTKKPKTPTFDDPDLHLRVFPESSETLILKVFSMRTCGIRFWKLIFNDWPVMGVNVWPFLALSPELKSGM